LTTYDPSTRTVRSVRWTVHGERSLYESEWLRLVLVDVEIPDGERFEHHVVRFPNHAAGTVVRDPERGVLLLWRHRFITDTWGWEIPAGRIDPGETPAEAAARETLEETGWQPGPLSPLFRYQPTNGVSDQSFHIFVADGATHVGDPTDHGESERVEWVGVAELRRLVQDGRMLDGLSLTSVLYALAFDTIS
jgi:8-oxo-dGTP pyrophosphatase MutT (NUDIX family)